MNASKSSWQWSYCMKNICWDLNNTKPNFEQYFMFVKHRLWFIFFVVTMNFCIIKMFTSSVAVKYLIPVASFLNVIGYFHRLLENTMKTYNSSGKISSTYCFVFWKNRWSSGHIQKISRISNNKYSNACLGCYWRLFKLSLEAFLSSIWRIMTF